MESHKEIVDEKLEHLFKHFHEPAGREELLHEPWLYQIWDINQKFLFLKNDVLIAEPLNSNTGDLITLVPNRCIKQTNEKIFPIFMGSQDETQTLCCEDSGSGQPNLKFVKEHIMSLYKECQECKKFTFYAKSEGSKETCSFESAEFPGWFLSTSSESSKPVGLSHQGGADITLFYFEEKKQL
uniref:Interleukin-1 n=1 Tax=Salvator merianae TaxID=96440 RepID=A0A8D0E9R8_SALMN